MRVTLDVAVADGGVPTRPTALPSVAAMVPTPYVEAVPVSTTVLIDGAPTGRRLGAIGGPRGRTIVVGYAPSLGTSPMPMAGFRKARRV